MSRTGIGYQEVELAAEKLSQQGISPTIERIRVLLGTGSNTTVSKYLYEWKSKQLKSRVDSSVSIASPSDSINQAVEKVWQQLQSENQAKLEALKEDAKQKIQLAQEEKEQVLDELDGVKEDNQQLRALLKDVREQNEAFSKEQIRLNQALAVLESKCQTIAESEQKFKQFADVTLASLEDKYQKSVNHYESQLSQNKDFYTNALSQLKESSESQRHEHILEIDHLQSAHKKLQIQLAEKEKNYFALNGKVEKLSELLQNQQEKLMTLLAQFQKNEKQVACIKTEVISQIEETFQSLLEKQTKLFLSVVQPKINQIKKTVKGK